MNHHLKAYNFAIERMSMCCMLQQMRQREAAGMYNPINRDKVMRAAIHYQNEAARWYKVAELHKSQCGRYEAYHNVDKIAYASANGHYVV